MSGTSINMVAVYLRNEHARLIVAGFAASTPSLCGLWEQLDRALADIPALGSVVARLTTGLADVRLDRANLIAAIHASLGADADGDHDPFSYLRDELAIGQARPGLSGGDCHGA
jgi:hypothetical protein